MTRNNTGKEQIIRTICNSHCGGNCEMQVHVKNGRIIRIEPDDREGRPRMCLRGHAYRQRVYAPDRILYPLKRTGPRGAGEFSRISWEEALDTIAFEMKKVKSEYGNAAFLHFCSMCDPHVLHHVGAFHRLLCKFGGYTAPWGFISNEAAAFSAGATYGTYRRYSQVEHDSEEYLKAKYIIMWSWNPVDTEQGTNTPWHLMQAKEKGAKIICVDPRYTDSAAVFADKWIPVRPGTDTAVLVAMANVIINENLHDEGFINSYTSGFEKYKEYVLGSTDGLPKTPEWASAISGVAADEIKEMARLYATEKPAVLATSIAAGRTAFGEQYHRAAAALEAITGNLEFNDWQSRSPKGFRINPHPTPPNQVEQEAPPRWNALPFRGKSVNSSARVNISLFADAILKGKEGGYPADYKFLWLSNTNYLNQLSEVNKTAKAFERLEFMLVTEQFMTASARYADVILPVCTFLERTDIMSPRAASIFGGKNVVGILNKAIEPLGESKSQLQICEALAPKLGITDYGNEPDENRVREIVAQISEEINLPDFETLRKEGIHIIEASPSSDSLKGTHSKPSPKPFSTPSEKIDIYSDVLARMNHPQIPAVPTYIEPWESIHDPLTEKYPLQLITPHIKRRAHSQFDNLPWLRELQEQRLSIHSTDAELRGIRHGDMVRIYNDRGEVRIPADVTERIMPGVVAIPQGAWYTPDKKGIDYGGCANVLTKNATSPGGSFVSSTALVQVEKEDR
ncbi:MAG: molybdopterin-dependent oxidoreductase [Syntrophales bacterium]|nr:molybdopterin-dependent oxidoreductase [Syntrophales bacterium]MDY0044049.1 molybdopterin-dependent oxidoreductase [Syntrophales bacterium]